jgi:acylphosphatase
MVMFRDFIQRKARKLGLVGRVKNEDDGTVRVVAEGEKDNLEKLISLCYNGPILSKVDKIDVDWQEPNGEFDEFEIKY